MHITFVSIFPDVYISFLETSLIKKAQEKWLLTFSIINPRDFCADKHKQIDDEIYGWWAGMLIKAQPVIDAVESAIKHYRTQTIRTNVIASRHPALASRHPALDAGSIDSWSSPEWQTPKILFLSPSDTIFTQKTAYEYSTVDHIIFVSWRYEGIDYRFEQYMQQKYPHQFQKISLWQFVTLWWELPSMTITEAIVRLIPWVIKEEASHLIESYDPEQWMQNIEYPQYTRPEEVQWLTVPEVLLSGNHKQIEDRRNQNTKHI